MEQLRTVILPGELAKKFGKYHKMFVSSPAEAVRALCLTMKGFQEHLTTSHSRGVEYAVFVGKDNLGKENLALKSSADKPIKIVPVIRGSKQGVLQTVLGAVLVVAGLAFAAPWAVQLGAALALGGVVQMLTPQTSTSSNGVDNGASCTFNGPVNTTAAGNPVPLLYGELMVGGAIISGGVEAVDQ
jgi:predicted phage tail protein